MQDINEQLNGLVFRHYLGQTPFEWFQHIPRYLTALQRRIEKVPADPLSDRKNMLQVKPFAEQLKTCSSEEKVPDQALQQYRWMIEEFRVSLFAQQLKTSLPISAKRLTEQYQQLNCK